MHLPRPLTAALFGALLIAGPLAAQTPPVRTQEASIRELMEVTGAGKLGAQFLEQMLPNLKQMAPELSEDYWLRFSTQIRPEEMVDLIVPVYAKHLSQEDVEVLVTFYKSPLGRRVIEKMPIILSESMVIGQQWGQKLGQQVLKDVEAEKAKPRPSTTR